MKDIKVTTYVVTVVDLQCSKCCKKIKKLLCRYKEIKDQVFDVKKNTVTIKVFCCTPERIRQDLICKGCKFIRCISIPPPPDDSDDTAAKSTAATTDSAAVDSAADAPWFTTWNVNIMVQTYCQQWYGVPCHSGCSCYYGGCTQWRYGMPCYCGCGGRCNS